jgi:hypothetical protein
MSARRLFFTPRFIYGGPLIITEVWHSPRSRRSYSRGLRLDQLPPVSELFVRPPGVTNSEEFTFLYPDNMQGLFGSGFVELDLARLLSQPRRTPASLTRPRLITQGRGSSCAPELRKLPRGLLPNLPSGRRQ